jgi:DNA-binding Lrp family transcriptional regulator
MSKENTPDARLLVTLQQGVPVDRRPFARIGADLGLTEEAVLARVRQLFETGVARRFGAVFESRSLGYASTLCAADIPAGQLEAAAARIAPHPGITHCYEREGHPNLWFTMTAPAARLTQEIERVAKALGPYPVLNLPALQKFKIEAVFGRDDDDAPPARDRAQAPATPAALLTEHEQQVVRHLQGNLAVSEDPFGRLAAELGCDPDKLIELIGQWKQSGVIRRIGLVMRHQRLGFAANSMCVWAVPADRIAAAGRTLAQSPHVTHCYERPHTREFPFNLYAMMHAKTGDALRTAFEELAQKAGLADGRMMWSVREFKKASPLFFVEDTTELG